MKIGRFVCVLLAMLMLAGFAGCVSAETIKTVDIKLTAPATGATASDATTTSNLFSVTDTVWAPSDATFNAATKYTAIITLTNRSGHTFADDLTVTLNSATLPKTEWEKSGDDIIVTHTFSQTADAKPIETVSLSIPEPLASNTPATTATTSTTGVKVSPQVTWDPDHKKFELGKEYTATIVLESTNEKAYPFTDDVTVKVNGYKATSVKKNSDSKVTVTYKFGETQPKGTAKNFVLTINAPAVGQKPSSSILKNSESDKTTATLSWGTTSTFQADTSYTATITVNARDGYVIDKNAVASVNGYSASCICESNEKAVITFTFTQISSVDSVEVKFTAPATGEKADTTAASVTTKPAGAANSATIKWTPELVSGEFEAGVEYKADVTIKTSGSLSVFDANTRVTINGYPAESKISSDYKTITASYTFPKTSFIPNPLEIIKEFFNLMLLMVNPASYSF